MKSPVTWPTELAVLSFPWLVFLGASAAFKRKNHISIDFLVKKVPTRLRNYLTFTTNFVVLIFFGYSTYVGIKLSIKAYSKLSSIMHMPYTYVDVSFVLGFGLMFFYQLKNLINQMKK